MKKQCLESYDVFLLSLGYTIFALAFTLNVQDLVLALAIGMSPLATIAVLLQRENVLRLIRPSVYGIVAGFASSIVLYLAFYMGNLLVKAMGLHYSVKEVYMLVNLTSYTPILLLVVSLAEEFYWRGWLQGTVLATMSPPWLWASIVYALAHVASGNPILVPAAFVAGLILGVTMERWGLAASSIAHFTWLIAAFYIAPYS